MKRNITLLAGLLILAAIYQPVVRAQQEKHQAPRNEARNSLSSLTTTAPSPACAANLLAEYVDWLRQQRQGGFNIVRVAASSNQKNRLVSYAEGTLMITASPFPSGAGQPPPTGPYTLSGTLTQYFSDRKFALSNGGGGIAIPTNPFSPQKTDQLGLSISTTGKITLTLKSYNNTTINLTGVDCAAGVLYGLTDTSPMQSFYVISLSKEFQAGPPTIK